MSFTVGAWSPIAPSGEIWSFGNNELGILGNNSTTNQSTPVQISTGGYDWVQLDASQFAAAIKTDGTLWTWGENNHGQLGNGTSGSITNSSSPTQTAAGGTTWKQVSTGMFHAIAVKTNGTLWSWGWNASGQLGNNTTTDLSTPTQIGTAADWASVSAGYDTSAGIKQNGTLWLWGNNSNGELGDGTTVNKSSPVQVAGTWKSVHASKATGLVAAIKTDGTLWLWGTNSNGELGDGTTVNKSSPVQTVAGGNSWRQVSCGYTAVGATKSDSTLWMWGSGYGGQLGLADGRQNHSSPVQVFGETSDWRNISVSCNYSVAALKNDGTLWTWGDGYSGELGVYPQQRDLPGAVYLKGEIMELVAGGGNTDTTFRSVVAGYKSVIAIRNVFVTPAVELTEDSGRPGWAWGENTYRQTGSDAYSLINTVDAPARVAGNWRQFSGGYYHTLGVKADGTLWSWGTPAFEGQLGVGDADGRETPVQVGFSNDWKQVAAGLQHSLMLKSDGTLWSTGYNRYGALGDLTSDNKSSLVQVGTDNTWKQVSAHTWDGISAGVKTDGTLWLWGYNGNNLLGIGPDYEFESVSSPIQVIGGGTDWRQVSCGYGFWAATKTDGTMWACGYNGSGQLGNGDVLRNDVSTPVQIGNGLSNWKEVTCGYPSSAAISTDDRFWVWGGNWWGELGMGDTAIYVDPQEPMPLVTNFIQASCGYGSLSGLTADGKIYSAGKNIAGELGRDHNALEYSNTFLEITQNSGTWERIDCGYATRYALATTVSSEIPSERSTGGYRAKIVSTNTNAQVGNGTTTSGVAIYQEPTTTEKDWKKISVGSNEGVVGIKQNGDLWAWGAYSGMFVLGNLGTVSIPTQVTVNGTGYKDAALGVWHGIGLKEDGTLYGWGDNVWGQIGQSTNLTFTSPTQIGTSSNWAQIAVGDFHTAGIKTDGTLWTWGMNTSSQLGVGDTIHRSSPTQVAGGGTNWVKVACGYQHTVALKADGTGWIWGSDNLGQLGFNLTGVSTASPILLEGRTNVWNSIGTGPAAEHFTAINQNNTLWTWGANTNGALGTGGLTGRSVPGFTVTLASTWSATAAGQRHNISVKSDGTLWGLGRNDVGQLGTNDRTNRSSPSQTVSGGTNWSLVSCGYSHSAAIKTDGTLWLWGQATDGQLGTNDRTNRSSPVQTIAGGNNWQSMGMAQWHSAAIKTDGTLWLWGRGTSGQLGNGATTSRSSPVQTIAGGTNWAKVAGGALFTAAIKTDGTLWLWGANNFGQLGDGTIVNKSSPVQTVAGGTNWSHVACGYGFTIARKTDGTVWTWGRNDAGQLGNQTSGGTASRSSPVQTISGGTNWASVGAGATTAAAMKTDGTIWTWGGSGSNGILGNGTASAVSSPVQVVGVNTTGWKDVYAFWNYSSGIRGDRTLWLWGDSTNGYLTLTNSTVNRRSSPIQVISGGSNWKKYGKGPGLAYKVNDTLWGWGYVNHKAYSNVGSTTAEEQTKPYPQMISAEYEILDAATSNGTTFAEVVQDESGSMYVIGDNTGGKLLDNLVNITNLYSKGGTWKNISIGKDHALAIGSDGRLWSWGNNDQGQLGDGTTDQRFTAALVSTDTSWFRVAAGAKVSLASKLDGTLWAWGNGITGAIGHNSTLSVSTPVQIASAANRLIIYNTSFVTSMRKHEDTWVGVYTQGGHSAGLKADCTIMLWGDNTYGQLGDGTTTTRLSPVQELGKHGAWSTMSVGQNHTAAIKGDGTLWTWGRNNLGQLGDGTIINKSSPVQTIAGGNTWKAVSCGYNHTIALKTDGTVWLWGDNTNGQLGNNTVVSTSSPIQTTTGGTNWVEVHAGGNVSGAIDINRDRLWMWGEGMSDSVPGDDALTPVYRQTGNNEWNFMSVGGGAVAATQSIFTTAAPAVVLEATPEIPWAMSAPPGEHKMSDLLVPRWTFSDGGLWGWGFGGYGGLANNNNINIATPTASIVSEKRWRQISTAGTHSAGITTTGELWLWGTSGFGELGNMSVTSKSSPVQTIWRGNDWVQVDTGVQYTLAIKNNSTLWSWGKNNSGQLGIGSVQAKSSPVQVPGLGWKQVSAGDAHAAGIKVDGTLWLWGLNTEGELGDGTRTRRSSPVQTIAGGTDWAQVSCGVRHTVAIKKDGSIWGWGFGDGGIAYAGGVNQASSPIQIVAAGTGWKQVSAGFDATAAIKNDGTLWVTGRNGSGKLGMADGYDRSTFTQVATPSVIWKNVCMGSFNMAGVSVDGTLWMVGSEAYGQLGDGYIGPNSTRLLSKVGTDADWKMVSISEYTTNAIKDEV